MSAHSISRFGSFMVGGSPQPALIRNTGTDGFNATIWADHMYVQYVLPEDVRHPWPVVFVHGGSCTGKSFEETPDGREGWVNYFVRQGFKTYWVDKPWRGRSGFNPDLINRAAIEGNAALVPEIQCPAVMEALDQEAAHWVFGDLISAEGKLGCLKETVPDFTPSFEGAPSIAYGGPIIENALVALLERIGPAILVGHSQGGGEVFAPLRLRPDLVAAVIAVEAAAPPTTGLGEYTAAPVLSLWAEERDDIPGALTSSVARDRVIIDGINAAGGKAEVLVLNDLGIRGNGHMMMHNTNSDQVAQVLIDWIERKVAGPEQSG